MNDMFIAANWPAPTQIKAFTTLRKAGDLIEGAKANRASLKEKFRLPEEPIWVKQTHSTIAIPALLENREAEGDATFTDQMNRVCIVLTADCLPILICNKKGTHVAAIHAGWRGLANGVIESTLKALPLPGEELLVWLGPAISQPHYEVGPEVRDLFLQHDPAAESAFIPSPNQRWLADLYALARLRLHQHGIKAIFGGEYCTYTDPMRFYSYRRDGRKMGNMASLIWIQA